MFKLDFKKYFMEHPEDAKEYGELKVKLVKQFIENHHMY
ncbi:hypothetical protein [Sutcliffiella horikoshii]